MKQTIEVEGLPEGWEIKPIKLPQELFKGDKSTVCYGMYIKLRKQPRRELSAQEIAEDYDPSAPNGYD